MCHEAVQEYVSHIVNRFQIGGGSCLDLGSLDVNGSVRHCFTGEYVGVDMRPGKNVDIVLDAHDIEREFGKERFDTIVCCEMMEHDNAFWVTMKAIGEVLKPGGRLILTTRGIDFPLHEYPSDYWRFTVGAGIELAKIAGLVEIECEEDPQAPGILLTARKPG
jgi:SAM-dependent methyltransferase